MIGIFLTPKITPNMTRTIKGRKQAGPSSELVSRRPLRGWLNNVGKKFSTGIERARSKQKLLTELKETK